MQLHNPHPFLLLFCVLFFSSPLTVGAGDIGRTEDSESSQENVGELNSTTIALSPVTADLLQHGIININVAAFSQLLGNAGENKVLSLTGSSRRGSGSGTGSGLKMCSIKISPYRVC